MHRYGDVEPNLQGRGHLKPNFTGDLCARSSITLRYPSQNYADFNQFTEENGWAAAKSCSARSPPFVGS